jgi:tRNA threonylcarbamoyladenosine biosynthesis protein TsaE
MRFRTRSAGETESLGAALGRLLGAGDVVVLSGDLGTGKTTFAKGVACGLGVRDPVTSPTFTIVQQYDGRVPLAHVDVSRLRRVRELHDLGIEELLDDHVVLVEWGDVVAPFLPADRVEVRIAFGDSPETRMVDIRPCGPRWTARGAELSGALGAA